MPARRSTRARLLPGLARLVEHIPPALPLAARPLLAVALASTPGWRAKLRRSMAGAFGPDRVPEQALRDYFRRLADLLAFSTVVYRSGMDCPALQREWLLDPASRERYVGALAAGKGVLLVAPHLTGMEIMVATVAREFPISVLARKAPDPEYEALKQRWYARLGVEVIHRPPRDAPFGPLAEMTAALRVLRRNGTLAITPDLLRKPGTGVPVRLFGKTAEIPAGPFFLAHRTGAALLPAFFHREGDRYRLWAHDPLRVEAGPDRDAAIAGTAQRWTGLFEDFLREHPDMWQFWLDKRWAAWLMADG